MHLSHMSALAFVVTLILPIAAHSNCDEIGHTDAHPDCSEEGSAGTHATLTMTNKVVAITEPPNFTLVRRCLLDDLPCDTHSDCAGALNFCVPKPAPGETDPSLIVSVATRVNTTCEVDGAVAIALDAVTPIEELEQQLMRQVLETALAGPFRIKFWLDQEHCRTAFDSEYPAVTGVQLIQDKCKDDPSNPGCTP